jgi:hypothetical protein
MKFPIPKIPGIDLPLEASVSVEDNDRDGNPEFVLRVELDPKAALRQAAGLFKLVADLFKF